MTTTSVLITATLAVVVCSLWVRRHTWRSRWEIGASLAIGLEGCALVLMSPWAAAALGPPLHRISGLWNIQTMLGHLCMIAAANAILYHVLVRLADPDQLRALFAGHIVEPVRYGVLLLVAAFVIGAEDYHRDLFAAESVDGWLTAYWLITGGLLIYLSSYAGRALLVLRADPRARRTADIYLVSAGFGMVACALQMVSGWFAADLSTAVWLLACLAVATSACGSARSWRAKMAWFGAADGRFSRPVLPPRAG